MWVVPVAVLCSVGGAVTADSAALAAVLGAVAGLLLLAWRAMPAATVVAIGVVICGYFSAGLPDGPIWVPLLLGSFLAGLRLPERRWAVPVGVAVLFVAIGSSVRVLAWDVAWQQSLGQAVGGLALGLAAALLGSLIRSRTERERERAARVATEEQLAMARDLHDGVGHGLAVIAMQAGVALHVLDRDPAAVRRSLEAIRDTSRESLDALRSELARMSGADRRAPERGLPDIPALVDRVRDAGPAVTADVTTERVPGPSGAAVEAAAYAIAQEALTNVLRHSGASRVRLQIGYAGSGLAVRVSDNGHGTASADAGADGADGIGLLGMRQRAEDLGGRFAAGPDPDGPGFLVSASLPINQEAS